jgi:hypothetical protein
MFSNENDFRKNDFSSVFDCIPKSAPKNILQCCAKDKAEGMRGEACVF